MLSTVEQERANLAELELQLGSSQIPVEHKAIFSLELSIEFFQHLSRPLIEYSKPSPSMVPQNHMRLAQQLLTPLTRALAAARRGLKEETIAAIKEAIQTIDNDLLKSKGQHA